LHNASLLTVSLSELHLKVGTDTVGVTLDGGSVKVAVLGAPAPTTPATDSRSWLAIDASEIAGSIHVGDVLTAALSHVAVQVNKASGFFDADGAGTGTPVNAGVLDWATVPGSNLTLKEAKISVSGSLDTLNIADLVSGSAQFAVTKGLVDVTVEGGMLHNASLLSVTLSELHLNVGTDAAGVTLDGG